MHLRAVVLLTLKRMPVVNMNMYSRYSSTDFIKTISNSKSFNRAKTSIDSEFRLKTEPSIKSSPRAVEKIRDFSDFNSDEFGTLSKEMDMNRVLENMPEEEGDKVEYLIHDETGRNIRRKMEYYIKVMDKLIKKKKISEAIDLLETRMLKKDKVKPSYYIYNLLINGCARLGYCHKAFKLYNAMKKSQVKPTPATYTGLLNACANSPFPEDALMRINNLRTELNDKGIPLNEINYNVMIKAYGRVNDIGSAFAVVDEMLSKKYFLNEKTFIFLFQSCISDKKAGFRHALVLWHKMKTMKVSMNGFVYNNFLRCVRDCGIGDVYETLNVIKQIQESRWKSLKTDLNVSNPKAMPFCLNTDANLENNDTSLALYDDQSLIEKVENRPNLLGRNPHLGNIIQIKDVVTSTDRLLLLGGFKTILEKMKEDCVQPDVKTFTLLLDMIPSTVVAEEVLLKEMKSAGVPLDIDFCNMLIKKRAFRRDYESGRAVLELIQSLYLNPDIVTFGVLALCCKTVSEAKQLMADMKLFGYRLNIEILGGMLKNACYTFNYPYVMFLLHFIKKTKIQPNEKFMTLLKNLNEESFKFFHPKKNRKKSITVAAEKNPQHYEDFKMFRDYYVEWTKDVTVFVPPHPYAQFIDKTEFNDELEKISNDKRGFHRTSRNVENNFHSRHANEMRFNDKFKQNVPESDRKIFWK